MNELFKWLLGLFRSPNRIQIVEVAERASAMASQAMEQLQEIQTERIQFWDDQAEMKHEIADLKQQDQECKESLADARDKIVSLQLDVAGLKSLLRKDANG